MKKIPTLFERIFDNHHKVGINNKVHPGMEWVLSGEGIATEKIDGSCCAIIGGVFYKRYDAKRGKIPPANAIPCCDPDPIPATGRTGFRWTRATRAISGSLNPIAMPAVLRRKALTKQSARISEQTHMDLKKM